MIERIEICWNHYMIIPNRFAYTIDDDSILSVPFI